MLDRLSRLTAHLLLATGLGMGNAAATNGDTLAADMIGQPGQASVKREETRFADPKELRDSARKISIQKSIGLDPDHYCIKPREAVALAQAFALGKKLNARFTESATYTPSQKILAQTFRDFAINSEAGRYYASIIARNDIWICDSNDSGTAGMYYPLEKIIGISLRSRFVNEAGACQDISYFENDPVTQAHRRLVISEEIIHAAQDYTGGNFAFGYGESNTHRGFDILHFLATEAQAKTIAAVIAADEYLQGDGISVEQAGMILASYDYAAIKAVVSLYMTYGRDAVMKDASLLYPVFTGILQDQEFLNTYFYLNAAAYNENGGSRQPAYGDFSRTFNSIPGLQGTLGLDRFPDYRSFMLSLTSSPAIEALLTQYPENGLQSRPALPAAAALPAIACHNPNVVVTSRSVAGPQ